MEKQKEQLRQFIDKIKEVLEMSSSNSNPIILVTPKKDLEEAGIHATFFLTLLKKSDELSEKSQSSFWDSIKNEVNQFLVLSEELLKINNI
jgi:hypothetical protein